MSRPVTIFSASLLEAARIEFLAHGMRATSLAIARRAGVSPGILFHRFGNKETLFRLAMSPATEPHHDSAVPDLNAYVGRGEIRATLVEVGLSLVERFFVIIPHQMTAWANSETGSRKTWFAQKYTEHAIKGQKRLVGYLEAEMKLGRLQQGNPDLIAQTFAGALFNLAFEQLMGGHWRPRHIDRQDYVHGLVDVLWNGLRPFARPRKRAKA